MAESSGGESLRDRPAPGNLDSSDPSAPSFRRVLTVPHAVAIYVSSVLGSGILITPGLAARTAGAASLFAWVLLSLASYPFAHTFASLAARNPESGGIYSFANEAFGRGAGTMTAWLFVVWMVLGAPAITLAAGTYLAYALPISGPGIFAVAASIILAAYGINLRGIKFSSRVQIAVIALILVVLSLAVVASSPKILASNFTLTVPTGISSVGIASALIVWSYLGYENVPNVAAEFKNPKRDFGRSVSISVLLIAALYLSVAFTVIGTGAYSSGGGVTPFAEMMSNALGHYAGIAVSLLAVVIIFSTVNAYTGGMARVVYAAARQGSLPSLLGKLDTSNGVPRNATLFLLSGVLLSLTAFYILQVDIQVAFIATSGAAVLTYAVGSAAGIKLLREKGVRRILPWVSLIASLVILPFVGALLYVSAIVASMGFLYGVAGSRGTKILSGERGEAM